jgi:hypothetical protein
MVQHQRLTGANFALTAIPPSTAWKITPPTSTHESVVRSSRRGTRRREPSTAAITTRQTRPVNRRLICSMA